MSKDKMRAAKELIQQKRYAEARAILKTVKHPTAKNWLKKLDQINPPVKRNRLPGVALGMVVFVAVGLGLTLFVTSRLPKPMNTTEIADLPTLNVLPSDMPTDTASPSPIPSLTFTLIPTNTPTVTASATITDTPLPTTTLIPTDTPTPLPPTAEPCDALSWEGQITDIFTSSPLSSTSEVQALIDTVNRMTYPSCVALARNYFLSYLGEELYVWQFLDASTFDESDRHSNAADQYFSLYMDEIDRVVSIQTINPFFTEVTQAPNPSSYAQQPVQQPVQQSQPADHPAGATALCGDGSYSYAASHRGACSHHHGVAVFYN